MPAKGTEGMKDGVFGLLSRQLRFLLLAVAVFYIFVFCFVVVRRIHFPYTISWLESYGLDAITRIVSGKQIYVAPSLEFVPAIYTPLYFYLSAFVFKLTGSGFFSLRLVSVLASLGALFIIYQIVKKETASPFLGIISCGFYAALYKFTGMCFDIGRVDALFNFFLLASMYCLRFYASRMGYAAAGILITFAFLTKQSALFVSLFFLIYALAAHRKLVLYFIAPLLVALSLGTLIFDRLHDGWYFFYVFQQPAEHIYNIKAVFTFWTRDLFTTMPVACVAASYYLLVSYLEAPREKFLFYSMVGLGMLSASWILRMHVGDFNVLLPACAMMSLFMGLGMGLFTEEINSINRPIKKKALQTLFYGICILQLTKFYYDPFSIIPRKAHREANAQLIEAMKSVPGDVFAPFHSYLTVLAGKKQCAYAVPIWDILRSREGPVRDRLLNELRNALSERKFGGIFLTAKTVSSNEEEIPDRPLILYGGVLDREWFWWDNLTMGRYYERQKSAYVFKAPAAKLGLPAREEYLYVPKS